MGPSSPTYDVGTPTSDNEIQSMKGNEDSFGFNLDQTGCGQVPIIPLSGLAFIWTTFFKNNPNPKRVLRKFELDMLNFFVSHKMQT